MIEELILDKKQQAMTANQIKVQDVANCIEYCAVNNNYWIDKQEIAKELEVSIDRIQEVINESEQIIVNKQGALTTRSLYKEKTPFLDKLLHSIKNKIE